MGNHMNECSHLMIYYHKVRCDRTESLSQCCPMLWFTGGEEKPAWAGVCCKRSSLISESEIPRGAVLS